MRDKLCRGFSFALCLTLPAQISFGAAVIDWNSDFDTALARSAKEQKWVFLNFYTNSCPYCAKMDREVFAQPEVARLVSRFVPVKLNAELAPKVALQYQVSAFPSSLILDSHGEILERIPGYMPADEFVMKITPAAEGKNPLELLEQRAAAMPESATVQLVVGYQFLERQHYARGRPYLRKGYELAPDQSGIREEGLRLVVASYLLEEELDGAESWVEKYEKEFPRSSHLAYMYLDLGRLNFEREAFADAASNFARAKDLADEFMIRVQAHRMLNVAKEKLGNPESAPATE